MYRSVRWQKWRRPKARFYPAFRSRTGSAADRRGRQGHRGTGKNHSRHPATGIAPGAVAIPRCTVQAQWLQPGDQGSPGQYWRVRPVAVFLIFALMAIPLRSYAQPLLIMSVIPFGTIGALAGHWILGIPVRMFSYFGIIALSGVVVNDSLILVDFVNRGRSEGVPFDEAVRRAARSRFRAILLTSLTTFLGLAPIAIFETSLQAQLVVPMAASLAFGILFATVITLFLIPTLYLILDDFQGWWKEALNEVSLGSTRVFSAIFRR